MVTVMMILLILLAIILIIAVLLQPGKGMGLVSEAFGGLAGQFGSVFGVRRTATFLQKVTIATGAAILVLSLLTNLLFVSSVKEEEQRRPATVGVELPPPPSPAPATPPAQPQQPAGTPQQQAPKQQ